MASYAFKAVDLAGAHTRGELEADDKQAVTQQLRAKGLIVLDIEEQKTTDLGDYFGRFKKVKAQALSVALRKHGDIFNELYIAMVSAGEIGGILEETLERVADQLEKDDSLRRQVKAAMMYPTLIASFAITVLLALVTFLVPVFEKVFKEFGGKLPSITQV